MFFQSLNLLEEVKGFYFFSQSTNPHKQLQGNFIHWTVIIPFFTPLLEKDLVFDEVTSG